MSKRSSQASPPKAKRPRQLQLDSFFSSPSKRKPSTTPTFKAGELELVDVDALDQPLTSEPPLLLRGVGDVAVSSRKPTMIFGAKNLKTDELKFQPLDSDPVFYDPKSQPWTSASAPYSFLAYTLSTLSQTRSRITIINSLTNALRSILERHPASLLPSLYLLSNSLSPQYVGIELGIGGAIISKAIQQVSGLSPSALKQLYTTTGDVGDVAFLAKSNVGTLIPHPHLTIPQVYESLLNIAACKGQGAAKEKGKIVEKLLVAGSGEEIRYLVRTLTLNLRVGAVRASILTALARAFVLHGRPQPQPQNHVNDSCYAGQDLLDRIRPLSSHTKGRPEDHARGDLKVLFEKAEAILKQVYVRHPCYNDIVESLLEHGLDSMASHVPLTVGIPLLPTLGSPTRSLDEIYARLGDLSFSAEFKYDGQRAQIHARVMLDSTISVKIFSRHLEDMTTKYPDVVSLVKYLLQESPSVTSFILDAEIVAVDPKTGELKSFQELSGRARKDVQLSDIRIPVSVYAFDMLYFNGEAYLSRPFRERREALRLHFPPHSPNGESMARFCHVKGCESASGRPAIMEFWERAVESKCEGLMIKVLDYEVMEGTDDKVKSGKLRAPVKLLPATYEPDKRTSAWLKLKKDYINDIGDSLDLIPIGAWHGSGRKVGWWSPILLGLWNPSLGRAVAVCKCMSGFTDEFYKILLKRYPLDSDTCSSQPLWECDLGGFRPDLYFKPSEVWELRGADITESPVSVAARDLSNTRGLSVRFPRFIQVRNEKGVEQAGTPEYLMALWKKQQKRPAVAGADDGDLVDVDMEDDFNADENESESD